MPTVADIAPISALLTHLTPSEPLRSGALTCIPLLTSGLADPDWLTLTPPWSPRLGRPARALGRAPGQGRGARRDQSDRRHVGCLRA